MSQKRFVLSASAASAITVLKRVAGPMRASFASSQLGSLARKSKKSVVTSEPKSIPPTVHSVIHASTGSTSPAWIPVDGNETVHVPTATAEVINTTTLANVTMPMTDLPSPGLEVASEGNGGERLEAKPSTKGSPHFLDPSSLVALGER